MRHMSKGLAAAVSLFLLGGCAGLKFFPDEGMQQAEVGLKTYYSKPYVLVARDGTSKITSVSVVYLPDLEHPVYAQARSGYGSANLTLAFSNGMLTSFGQQTDTKIPDTLTAFGGLQTSLATALKTRVEAQQLEKQSGDFGKYAPQLANIAKDLRTLVLDDKGHVLSENSRISLGTNAATLDGLASNFAAPGAAARADSLTKDLGDVSKAVGAIKPPADQLSEDGKKIISRLTGLQKELSDIVGELKPKPADPPALSLYEVVMKNGVTSLREVSLGGPVVP